MARARHIYNRLNATGWLEESHYGLKVTVDMPSGAMRLVEFLCGLREGVSEQIGGIVIQIKNGLEALQRDARDNALGLHKAARDAATFGRYLRSVLSALREIDKQVVDAASVGERLRHYFEDFVERLLLQDYVAITTTSHPYRFRHRILGTIGAIEESLSDIEAIAEAYVEAHLAADARGARDSVYDDLSKIRRVFDQIEDAFERIQQHRSRLETRLRNTVRYAGRRSGGFLQRSAPLLLKLDKLLSQPLEVDGLLEDRPAPICAALLTRPRHRRPIVAGDVLVLPRPIPCGSCASGWRRTISTCWRSSPSRYAPFWRRASRPARRPMPAASPSRRSRTSSPSRRCASRCFPAPRQPSARTPIPPSGPGLRLCGAG
jgi:hypothetical protein